MFQMFFPDEYVKSIDSIDFDKLYKEGYRGVIFDIDNTLVEHGKDATPKVIDFFEKIKKMGWNSCLLSNNKEERVKRFNCHIGTNYIFKANKPFKKNYKRACEKMGTSFENTIFVGDQLFTDVWGAKRSGIRNILVEPIDKKEEIQIVLKRYFERIVLYFYKQNGKCSKKMVEK